MTTEDRVSSLEQQVATVAAKVDTIIGEMRQQNQMRAEETRELRQKQEADIKEMRQKQEADIKEMRQKQEADMKEIRASLVDMGKHVRNLSLTAMAAIGAMVVTAIISLLRS